MTTTAVIGSSYGVTDWFDVGVSVPIRAVRVSGRAYSAGAFQSNSDTGVINPVSVGIGNGQTIGVGDVSVRWKMAFRGAQTAARASEQRSDHWHLGASGEFRLPTGDPDAMTGTGRAAVRGAMLASHVSNPRAVRSLETYFNGSFLWAGSGIGISDVGFLPQEEQKTATYSIQPSNEISVAAGVDTAITDRVTLIADYTGRGLFDSARYSADPFVIPAGDKLFSQPFLTPESFVSLHIVTAGAKIQILDSWVLSASVLYSPSNHGLKPGLTPVIGLERQVRRLSEPRN